MDCSAWLCGRASQTFRDGERLLLTRRRLGNDEAPIREELFGVERLESHARSLAVAQTLRPIRSSGLSLSPRLAENGRVLLSAYRVLVLAIEENQAITPAARWLIDNNHIVERLLRQISTNLPPGY
jgi:cyclic beta-1,2-glucan synthetase